MSSDATSTTSTSLRFVVRPPRDVTVVSGSDAALECVVDDTAVKSSSRRRAAAAAAAAAAGRHGAAGVMWRREDGTPLSADRHRIRPGTYQTWNWVIGSPGQWVIWVIFHVRVTGSSF